MKTIFFLLIPIITFSQVSLPSASQRMQLQNYQNQNFNKPYNPVQPTQNPTQHLYPEKVNRTQHQNQQIIVQTQKRENLQKLQTSEIYAEFKQPKTITDYNLPSLSNVKGTEYYRNVYDKMITLNVENYSVKDVNFEIENAYLENTQDKLEFDQIIKNSGDFIIAKMKELKYDTDSNVAKNYMLFQFFSENLNLKANGLKHTPFKYDFDDYSGQRDWTKMFVSKLLKTKTGQCHSMPILYLILAEQINAEAFLSFSPNHSFIKFKDKSGKWYNIELTNGMFTANSFMVNSGYIKAEALQNHIYLQNLSKQELLSEFYVDLANGYIHKFGYDDFVEKAVTKALELYPNNINAQMIKSNFSANRFEFVAQQLGINPRDNKQLQKIKAYPIAVQLLQDCNLQSKKVNQLGYTEMPQEAYESWLGSLKEAKQKQENEAFNMQFKGTIIKPIKD